VHLIRPRPACFLVLAALIATLGHAQEPASPNSSPSSSAKQAPSDADRVVLKVGDVQVTKEEFESRIREIEPGHGDEGAPDKDRQRLGDDYASVLMLSQQALAKHLDSSPEVARQLAIARMQVLSDAEFATLMQQAQPTFAEVTQYYNAHASDYEEVQIRRLFIWKQPEDSKGVQALTSQAARAKAEQIRKAYASGTDVKKLSGDLTKSQEGMLDPNPLTFSRGELSAQMLKVASSLKDGEWSEVEDTPARLLLIQLVKRDHQQLGQVSSHIEKQLQDKKMEALLNDLKKNAGIWMDEKYFGTAVAPVPDAQRRASNPPSELRKSTKQGD
jgi:parvulin-like peptidyl-prolyl cis-trans isomerase-like protein